MRNRIIQNAAWLIGCRVAQAIISFLLTMISARYLGPANYGLINYAASVVAFLVPLMQLGFDATLVQELVESPKEEGVILGTSLTMSVTSAILSMIGVAAFSFVVNAEEKETIIVCCLYSFVLVARALEMIQYWFQAKLLSKYTAIITLLAFVVVALYRIFLLVTGKSVFWFAVSQAIDFALIAIALLFVYKKLGGQKFYFSFKRGKLLLSRSKYYIISALMICVFAQTDKIMLKLLIDENETGIYSAAVACAGATAFVYRAIIDSVRPKVIEAKRTHDIEKYENRMIALFSILIYLSLIQSVIMSLFSRLIVLVLYGSEYAQASSVLSVLVWYTTFSYLGAARDIWILSENKQKYLLTINSVGAITNVALNLLLIPWVGALGASIASLITQFFINFVFGFIFKPIRACNILLFKSLNPICIYRLLKNH